VMRFGPDAEGPAAERAGRRHRSGSERQWASND
jgi:hypothetical protein